MARKKVVAPAPKPEAETEAKVERDENGRWLTLPPGAAPLITSDTARDMVRLREEKRRRLYAVGAQRVVQDARLIAEFGDDAHLVERAMVLQQIATTPDAGKAAVMADIQLQRSQGYDVRTDDGGSPPPIREVVSGVADAMMRILADIMRVQSSIPEQIHETIDGEIKE